MDILRINFKKAQLVKLFRLKLSKSNKNLLNSNFKKNIKHIETANKYNKQQVQSMFNKLMEFRDIKPKQKLIQFIVNKIEYQAMVVS